MAIMTTDVGGVYVSYNVAKSQRLKERSFPYVFLCTRSIDKTKIYQYSLYIVNTKENHSLQHLKHKVILDYLIRFEPFGQ